MVSIMNKYILKNQKKLRVGYTTGSCAAAAVKASAEMLLSGEKIEYVSIITPSGIEICVEIENIAVKENSVLCGVRKDSGDDPDVTDGIIIYAEVLKKKGETVVDGGKGIGRVTRRGLSVPVGQAAINPIPMRMIIGELEAAAHKYGYDGGFYAVISAENGEIIAEKTFNKRLGIEGGISILGTSGIVEPMSEKALLDTIRLEMDLKFLAGENIIAVCPGNYGRNFAYEKYNIDLESAVKCSNYVGEVIDYAVYKGFDGVLLIGHGGKLLKLACGVMNTHSSFADGRQEIFAAHSAMAGASSEIVKNIMSAITVDECLTIIEQAGIIEQVLNSIKIKVMEHLKKRCNDLLKVEFIIFTLEKGEIMKSKNALKFVKKITGGGA